MSEFVHFFRPPHTSDVPTFLVLHGTGGNEKDLVSIVENLWPGAGILAPRGKVSERGMTRWFRRFSEGQFDLQDVLVRAHELADFVAASAQEYNFDATDVWALGYSNGANIATATLLLRPEAFAGVIALRGQTVLKAQSDLSGKSVLMLNGEFDPLISVADATTYAKFLRDCGADVEQHFARADHSLTRAEFETARKWLEER